MKNILQKFFLIFSVFLFNWGYGQDCFSKDKGILLSTTNNPGVTVSTSGFQQSIAQLHNHNNLSNVNSLIDDNKITGLSFNNRLSPLGSTTNGVITINGFQPIPGNRMISLDYNITSLDVSGQLTGSATYTITTKYNGTVTNTFTKTENIIISIGNKLEIVSPTQFNEIEITINRAASLIQNIFSLNYIDVIPPCLTINCNTTIPLTKEYFGESLSASSELLASGANNLLSSDLTDYGTFAGIGSLSVKNTTPFTAGTYVGFMIEDVDLAAIASNLKITTYLQGEEQEFIDNTTIGLSLISIGKKSFGFKSTKDFDEVKIGVTAIAASFSLIYNAFIIEECDDQFEFTCENIDTNNKYIDITQPYFATTINQKRTGVQGVTAGVIFGNPQNVIDSNITNTTDLFVPAGVGNSASVAVQLISQELGSNNANETYFAGFEFSTESLLNVNLLKNITIEVWNNDQLVKTSAGSAALASVSALGGGSKSVIGINVNQPFDEIVFRVSSLLDVNLSTIKLSKAIVKKYCEGSDLSCNTNTIISQTSYPVSIGKNTGVVGVTPVDIGDSNIENTENIIDGNPTTYALINPGVNLLTTSTIAVEKLLTPYQAGTYVSFDIESTSLLDVSLLPSFSIRLLRNGTEVGNVTGDTFLLGASILDTNRKTLGYLAPADFDEIQLIYTQPAGISLGTIKVFDLHVMEPCPVELNCDEEYELNKDEFPVVINEFKTGPTSLACVGCAVRNANNLISGNANDYAELVIPVGLAAGVGVSVQDLATIYPQGTRVAFTVNDVPGLIQLDLLESVQLKTYLNGVLQESASATELIDLSILFSIGTGKKSYGFKTSKPFNEVQLIASSVVSAFNSLQVYNLKIDTSDSDGGGLQCKGNPAAEDDTFTLYPGQTSTVKVTDNDLSNEVQAIIGENVTFTPTPFTQPGITFTPDGYVTVAQSVPQGTYQSTYQICNINPISQQQECDEAIVQVNVEAAQLFDGPIKAVNDFKVLNYNTLISPRALNTETIILNILDNDYFEGTNIPIIIGSNAEIYEHTTVPSQLTFDMATGVVTTNATTLPGRYTFSYKIRNIANPTFISEANVLVLILEEGDLDYDNDGILNINENNCSDETPKVKRIVYTQDFGVDTNSPNLTSPNFEFPDINNTTIGIRQTPLDEFTEGKSYLNHKITNPVANGYYTLTTNASFVDDFNVGNFNSWSNKTSPFAGTYDHSIGEPVGNQSPGYMLVSNPENNPIIWRSPAISIDRAAMVEVSLWLVKLNITGANPNLTIEVHDSELYDSNGDSRISFVDTGAFTVTGAWEQKTISLPNNESSSIYILVKNNASSNSGNDFGIDDIIVSESYCDTDNDGIPNIVDLDSDNDGCYDALEAEGNVNPNDLDEFGQITGEVGETGIPIIVNQEVGNLPGEAYDSTLSSACNNTNPTDLCIRAAVKNTLSTSPTNIGISSFENKSVLWPTRINYGFFALESNDKGFVITRLDSAELIEDPKEGMIVYDKTLKCIRLYNGTEWRCIQPTCPPTGG